MATHYHSADGREFREPKLNALMATHGGQPRIQRKPGRYRILLIVAVVALVLIHRFDSQLDVLPIMFIVIFGGLYLLRDEYIVEPGGVTMSLSYHDVAIILGKEHQRPIVFVPDEPTQQD